MHIGCLPHAIQFFDKMPDVDSIFLVCHSCCGLTHCDSKCAVRAEFTFPRELPRGSVESMEASLHLIERVPTSYLPDISTVYGSTVGSTVYGCE